MTDTDDSSKKIIKGNTPSQLAKIFTIPIGAKASIEIFIDRANAEARIKIIEADLIIKYGLLRDRRKDNG